MGADFPMIPHMKVLCSQEVVSPHLWGPSYVRPLRRRLHLRQHGVRPGSWLHRGYHAEIRWLKAFDFLCVFMGCSSEASMKFGRKSTTEKSDINHPARND